MPKFIAHTNKELLSLRWLTDEGQTYESWQQWYKSCKLYAITNTRGIIMEGLMEEEASMAASAAAATFLGIVCAGGTMRAIVEEHIHPDDAFTIFTLIVKHYEGLYGPMANQIAIAFFNLPQHDDTSFEEYSAKATRVAKRLQATSPTEFSDDRFISNMLTTGDNLIVRTPDSISPAIRTSWHSRIQRANDRKAEFMALRNQAAILDPAAAPPAIPDFYAGITLSAFFQEVRAEQTVNPKSVVTTAPVMAISTESKDCWHFATYGNCRFGDTCKYKHDHTTRSSHWQYESRRGGRGSGRGRGGRWNNRGSGGQTREGRNGGYGRHQPHSSNRHHPYQANTRGKRARNDKSNRPNNSTTCAKFITGNCDGNCGRNHVALRDLISRLDNMSQPVASNSE